MLYYQLINRGIRRQLGGHHNAKSIMLTVDFAEIEEMQRAGEWDTAGEVLADASRRLEAGGADMVVLCTNTMHKVSAHIERATPALPFIHIADATASAITGDGLKRIGLLGTAYTMEQVLSSVCGV